MDASLAPHDAVADGFGTNSSQLGIMSVAMFAGAFAAGYVPFAFSFSASKLRRVTIAGAGLLIGTALIVIIPEGVHMYFDSVADSLHHHSDGAHSEEHHGHTHNHRQMGAALALGFCFMLLVDRLSSGYGHSHSAGSGSLPTVENAPGGHAHAPAAAGASKPSASQSAMLGLMVHAAVDGVALGATCFSGKGEASLMIFLAIMLHKAPAAFGLSTFLMSAGENNRMAKKQLFWFALSAPVGAVVTYYGMGAGLFGYAASTLALVMLFSGGTFLFVATVHILSEVMSGEEPLPWLETWILVGGALFPFFINLEHGH